MPISSVSTPSLVGGKGINDPALVKTLCEGTADAIDWLDANGMSLHNVSSFGGASVKRIHRPTNAEGKMVSVGAYLIPLMEENCAKRGIDIVLNTTVDTILTDAKGAAVGISGTDKDGNTVVVNAKSVVLATGPFYAIKVTAGVHHTIQLRLRNITRDKASRNASSALSRAYNTHDAPPQPVGSQQAQGNANAPCSQTVDDQNDFCPAAAAPHPDKWWSGRECFPGLPAYRQSR